MKYFIVTHGCQMNEHDSERIAAILEERGDRPADHIEEADLILFNTCLVRQNAEEKVFGQLGALKKWHREKPGRILGVGGCMMQAGSARETLKKSFPQVDLVFGTHNIEKLPDFLDEIQKEKKRIFDISEYEGDFPCHFVRPNSFSAYVNIMTGCNNYCSYCIVPYARGREKSLPPDFILDQIENLVKEGYQELMLLGQNVNSYGKDFDYPFPLLLEDIAKIQGLKRIRFMSSHPMDLSDRLIKTMADHPNIERHFHLPLQSGSDKVLEEMNRRYTREKFLSLVDKLRDAMPEITITTDIIVGFPGESEKDHQETLDLCQRVRFDNAFTFLYSPRPGTRAAKRADQVPPEVASRRFQELTETLYPIFYEKNQAMVGKRVEVLFDTVSKRAENKISGRDSGARLIHVPGEKDLVGKFRTVKISSANSFALQGVIEDSIL